MVIFQGNDTLAYRDPACFYHEGVYHLFFTVSEKENGYMYNYVAKSQSTDLLHWSPPRYLTPKDRRLNYCSPGNVIPRGDEFILCFTSYPMPVPYRECSCADQTARLFIVTTRDLEHFTSPVMLRPKGDVPTESMGRMIDPFLLPVEDGYHLFFKQNGVSTSFSSDLEHWEYRGHIDGGENACILRKDGEYLLVHSPQNGIAFSRSVDLNHWEEFHHTTLDQCRWPWANGRVTAGFAMEAPEKTPYKYILFFHGSRDVFPETHGNASLAMAFTDNFTDYVYEINTGD